MEWDEVLHNLILLTVILCWLLLASSVHWSRLWYLSNMANLIGLWLCTVALGFATINPDLLCILLGQLAIQNVLMSRNLPLKFFRHFALGRRGTHFQGRD